MEAKRRPHNRLGFALQLMTVRYVGTFLDDPLQIPGELLDYLAEQLQIEDPSCVKSYGDRERPRSSTCGRFGRPTTGRSTPRERTSSASGSRAAPGQQVTARKRCSTRRSAGCGNDGFCCRAPRR